MGQRDEGGSRRISSSWAEHRFDWLDEKGRPSPATNEDMGPVREVADMEEHTYQYEEGAKQCVGDMKIDDIQVQLTVGVDEGDEHNIQNCIEIVNRKVHGVRSAVSTTVDPLSTKQGDAKAENDIKMAKNGGEE